MTKRVFIIHRWSGNPNSDWYPWIKSQLEQRGYVVKIPEVPDSDHPTIESWVNTLKQTVGKVEDTDIFVGHSIGCQGILRFLEQEGDPTSQDAPLGASKVIMVAPWLTMTPEATPTEDDKETAKPWLETPIDFEKVKTKANLFVGIFSDDDPYVPFQENSRLFKEKLRLKVVTESGKGHFTEDDGVTELPILLDYLSFA